MDQQSQSFWATAREIARLSFPYFRSEEKWFARGAMLTIIGLSLVTVAVGVRLATWQRDFFNAMQQLDQPVWVQQLWIFGYITALQVAIGMVLIYVTQRLEIRWRKWMTQHFLDRWLDHHAHYRMQMGPDAVDNPDQRMSMDIPLFIQRTLHMTVGDRSLGPMSTGLLTAFATLFSFSVMLWTLSAQMPLSINGQNYHVPGFLLWAALLYAGGSTVLAHIFGRQLIPLRFDQQRYEADFRFDMVRVRENSEQIALLQGEPVEKARLMTGFGHVARNWHALMMRQVKLTAVTGSIAGVTMILPSLLVAPAFFHKVVGYGELMQISTAFLSVQGALSFFVANYPLVAEWKSVIDRLGGLDRALSGSHAESCRIFSSHRREGEGF
jgi:putative ATP-binding cassette transporter